MGEAGEGGGEPGETHATHGAGETEDGEEDDSAADTGGDDAGEGDAEDGDADEDEAAASETDPDNVNHGDGPASDRPVFHPEDGALMDKAIEEAVKDITKEWRPSKLKLGDAGEFAKKVFGGSRKSKSRNWKELAPTPQNRQAVVKMARVLETLTMPAITKTKLGSALPPGRFRSRDAIRASADRAAGRMTEAKPWTTTKRRHSHVRPVIVGIATDTSGSMGWAENAVAEYAYIMSNAGHRIGARTAAVTFGDQAEAVSWPGQIASKIRVRAADGGKEAFDDGIAALDGVLNLTRKNDAAKLLLIVSDGHLVRSGETDKARQWMDKCDEAGVAVVWLTIGGTGVIKPMAPKAQVVTIDGVSYYGSVERGTTIVDQMLAATKAALEKLEA
jgi:hypothetical protein